MFPQILRIVTSKVSKRVIIKFSKDANGILHYKTKLKGMDLNLRVISSPVFINNSPCQFYKTLWRKCSILTVQKMKFSIQDFLSKYDQIHSFLRIWSHLLKKSLMENFIFCAVFICIVSGYNQGIYSKKTVSSNCIKINLNERVLPKDHKNTLMKQTYPLHFLIKQMATHKMTNITTVRAIPILCSVLIE